MERAVILFDDNCGFCGWSLSKILAWDRHGHLRPVALRSPAADHLLMGMDPERKMASWHLVSSDGRSYSGGEALSHLARLLPAGAPIALLVRAFPRTTDRSYRWVARHRDRMARALGAQACQVNPGRRKSAFDRWEPGKASAACPTESSKSPRPRSRPDHDGRPTQRKIGAL